LDVLNGMSVEELKTILGEPTRTRGDAVEWYYSSQMHVNPGLRVQLKDGKAVEAKGFRG
jgi:outer membrane protein assembly factor BamE (lipoprotein component of BamABCDE complex)